MIPWCQQDTTLISTSSSNIIFHLGSSLYHLMNSTHYTLVSELLSFYKILIMAASKFTQNCRVNVWLKCCLRGHSTGCVSLNRDHLFQMFLLACCCCSQRHRVSTQLAVRLCIMAGQVWDQSMQEKSTVSCRKLSTRKILSYKYRGLDGIKKMTRFLVLSWNINLYSY